MSEKELDELAQLVAERLRLDEKSLKRSALVDTKHSSTATAAAAATTATTPLPQTFSKFISTYPPDSKTYYGFTPQALAKSWNLLVKQGNRFRGRPTQML